MRISVSPDAKRDLLEIDHETADRFGEAQAIRLADEFGVAFRRLLQSPDIGRARPELSKLEPPIRAWHVSDSFVVLYRRVEIGVQVMRVFHHARDVDSLFPDTIGTDEDRDRD